jgi:hypothetical protein
LENHKEKNAAAKRVSGSWEGEAPTEPPQTSARREVRPPGIVRGDFVRSCYCSLKEERPLADQICREKSVNRKKCREVALEDPDIHFGPADRDATPDSRDAIAAHADTHPILIDYFMPC